MRILFLAGLLALSQTLAAQDRGIPWNRHTIDRSSQGADGVRLADANGDGLMDVATGWEEGGVIRIYINPGYKKSKLPWPAVTVGQVRSPEDAVLADLDGDGAMDVVSCCEGKERSVWIHWAPKEPLHYLDPKAWISASLPCVEKSAMWMYALPMQIDSRNGIDLVIGAKGKNASIGWLESPPDPRRLEDWTFHPLQPAGWIMSLRAHDMDDDGDLDIVASDRKGERRGCYWLENPGLGKALYQPWKRHPITTFPDEYMFLDLADLDGDGITDLVSALRGGPLVYERRESAAADRWKRYPISLPSAVGTGKSVRVVDIDLDGRLDIAVSCENARENKSGLFWLSYKESVTDPVWDAHEISGPLGIKYDRIECIDLDGDGDLDVMTCEERVNLGVIWYENPTVQ